MRVALCISGMPRYVKEGHHLFSKNLLGFEKMDIFIHTWVDKDTGVHKGMTRLDSIEEVKQLYNVTNSIEEAQRYDIAPQGVSKEEFVHWSMFYSVWSANNLKKQHEVENNMEYDCVIRTRFDCALLEPLNVAEYTGDTVYAPWIHRGTTIMDWFNFSTSKTMDIHTNVWKDMPRHKKAGVMMTSGEELLTAQLQTNNIEFKSINKEVKLMRTNGTTNTWLTVE